MDADTTFNKIEEIIDQFLANITEYTDSVQVSVSFIEEVTGDTVSHHKGAGNWFARQGLARDFIQKEKARIKIQVKKDEYSE